LCALRADIMMHILKDVRVDENRYFDLDIWSRKNLNNDAALMATLTSQIMKELEKLGWKCKTSFGSTGLFIYSTEKQPASCYDDF
jgi:hypothetical protein